VIKVVKIIISLEGNKPDLKVEGKVKLGVLLQLLDWASKVILNQDVGTENIEQDVVPQTIEKKKKQ
jgi:hypothetical protein